MAATNHIGYLNVYLHKLKIKKNLIVFIYLAVLGLCCCTRAFSSRGKWGLLSGCGARASHCSGFFCSEAQAIECRLSSWGA